MCCMHRLNESTADVEAEDIDLGDVQKEQAELAADIDRDGAAAEEDAEALDSDADSDADDELGIDKEETDGAFLSDQRTLYV